METSISLQDSKDGCRNTITFRGVPKIRGTILGTPIIKTIVGGLCWGSLFWETTFS